MRSAMSFSGGRCPARLGVVWTRGSREGPCAMRHPGSLKKSFRCRLRKTWSVPDLVVEQALGGDRDAAVLEGAPDAVRLAVRGLEPARQVEELLRLERVAGRVADHHHARLKAFFHVLRDDDADLAAIQLYRAAERKNADAADELLDQHRIEEG